MIDAADYVDAWGASLKEGQEVGRDEMIKLVESALQVQFLSIMAALKAVAEELDAEGDRNGAIALKGFGVSLLRASGYVEQPKDTTH